MKPLLLTLSIAGLLASPVQAGRCVIRQKAVVVQQQVLVPVVADYYYQVSQSLQIEALIRKAVREELRASQAEQLNQVQPLPAIAANCAKCHSGAEPKGGVTIDGITPLTCDIAVQAQRNVLSGKMPKDHPPLSPEVKGDLLQELLDLVPQEPK